MQVYLLELSELQGKQLEQLFQTLPPQRAALLARCTRQTAKYGCALGYHLVRHAARKIGFDLKGDWLIGKHGKPYLENGPHFSLSHTDHGIAVAIDPDCEIGLDIEEIKPHHPKARERFCSKEELALLSSASDPDTEWVRLWSAKEAEIKRLGCGFAGADPKAIDLSRVQSTPIMLGGAAHWLSLSPAEKMPVLTLVTLAELL